MKKVLVLLLLTLSFVILTNQSFAQFRAEGTKVGLQFNLLWPANEFNYKDGTRWSYEGRAFARFDLMTRVEGEFGAGYAKYAGNDFSKKLYSSNLIPIDFRLLYSPFDFNNWNLYLYAGIGLLHYSVSDFPYSYTVQWPQHPVEDKGWTGFIPAGIGAQMCLSSGVVLEANIGFGYSFTENLNYYYTPETPKDAYYNAGLGLTFALDKKVVPIPVEIPKGITKKPEPVDSDKDGLIDEQELALKTNPNNPDTDGDGLSDGDEIMKYKTNPLNADTDGDGLNDGDELLKFKTNPQTTDTDGDGLSDGDEVLKYKTDPLQKDTDKGTINDYSEVTRGTNPLDKSDDIPVIKAEVGQAIVLEGIVFKTGSAEILPASAEILQKALNTLTQYPEITVQIQGHTDNVGKKATNKKLSLARAESVKKWLMDKGIDGARLATKGFGPDKPIASNKTAEGKQKNRRIEFVRTK